MTKKTKYRILERQNDIDRAGGLEFYPQYLREYERGFFKKIKVKEWKYFKRYLDPIPFSFETEKQAREFLENHEFEKIINI